MFYQIGAPVAHSDTSSKLMVRVQNIVEFVLPVLRDLREELGAERANALVLASLRRSNREWIKSLAPPTVDDPLQLWQRTSDVLETHFDGDVVYEIQRDDDAALDLNVSFCRYAEYFRSIGEPELGAVLTCELDNHIVDLGAPAVELSRDETIMMGAKTCPFRYKLKSRSRTN